jgi:hypothetical protein
LLRITLRERGIFIAEFIAEPFLLVGLIAVVRPIRLLTAGLEQGESTEQFQNMLIELGMMTGLVIVLTIALYFTRRMRLSEKELENSEWLHPTSCGTRTFYPLVSSENERCRQFGE